MEHIETVIIGAGQAGLSTAYHLKQQGRDCVVLDRNQRIGDDWRQQWDSLRLYSPAQVRRPAGDAVPGRAVVVPRQGRRGRLPRGVRRTASSSRSGSASASTGCRAAGTSGFVVDTSTGRDHAATTSSWRPAPSGVRRTCPTSRRTSTRRSCSCTRASTAARASSRDGPVLVVGASHSGSDIAYEVGRDPADHARRPRLRADPDPARVAADEGRLPGADVPVAARASPGVRPIGRKEMRRLRFHGGPMLRVKRSDLAERGVVRNEARVEGVRDGLPVLADGTRRRRRQRRLGDRLPPGVRLDRPARARRGRLAEGVPRRRATTRRGCSSAACRSSTRSPRCCVGGAGRDAEHVARRIAARAPRAGRAA